jgi:hypothetical protein
VQNETSGWNAKDLSFIPLRPERVVEVRYDHGKPGSCTQRSRGSRRRWA